MTTAAARTAECSAGSTWPRRVILLGNPNVGKSVLFSRLTRTYASVSNYPGTTVEIAVARASGAPGATEVIDTPGVHSLTPLSEEERVTRDVLLDSPDAVVVQVADMKNLRRSLLLALEIAELETPSVLALNMRDEAAARGILVDEAKLAGALGVPVVGTVATRGVGVDALERAISAAAPGRRRAELPPDLAAAVEEAAGLLPSGLRGRRGIAAMLLSGDARLGADLSAATGGAASARIEAVRARIARGAGRSVASRLTRARLREADRLVAECSRREPPRREAARRAIDRLAMHPLWGIPILLAVLLATYEIVGVFGAGVAVGFLEESVFGRIVTPLATRAAAAIPSELVREALVGPYGLVTMALTYSLAIVLPIVFFFFLVFGLLEDSGYLPRLAATMNRAMRMVGLNGKAVLPMVLGLGCDTMATLTTRILETKKEKVLTTFLLALGVPCSAQLAVVLALTSRLSVWATVIWASVVLATIAVVGWIAARLVPGDGSDFILELPPLRVPGLGNIVRKTLARLEWYLKEAVPLFALGTLLLFVLAKTGALAALERLAAPVVVRILSLPPEAAGAFVAGFLRRDYGAVFLGEAARSGALNGVQVVVALVTLTLFVPCVANFFIMIKERGWKTAAAMAAFIFPFAILVGGLLNWSLRALRISL